MQALLIKRSRMIPGAQGSQIYWTTRFCETRTTRFLRFSQPRTSMTRVASWTSQTWTSMWFSRRTLGFLESRVSSHFRPRRCSYRRQGLARKSDRQTSLPTTATSPSKNATWICRWIESMTPRWRVSCSWNSRLSLGPTKLSRSSKRQKPWKTLFFWTATARVTWKIFRSWRGQHHLHWATKRRSTLGIPSWRSRHRIRKLTKRTILTDKYQTRCKRTTYPLSYSLTIFPSPNKPLLNTFHPSLTKFRPQDEQLKFTATIATSSTPTLQTKNW